MRGENENRRSVLGNAAVRFSPLGGGWIMALFTSGEVLKGDTCHRSLGVNCRIFNFRFDGSGKSTHPFVHTHTYHSLYIHRKRVTANVLNWYMQLKGVSVSILVHRSFCRFQTSLMFSKIFKSQTPDTAAEPRAVGGPVKSAMLWCHRALAGHTVTRYNTSLMPPPCAAGPTVPCAQLVGQAECERMQGGGAAEPTLPGGGG